MFLFFLNKENVFVGKKNEGHLPWKRTWPIISLHCTSLMLVLPNWMQQPELVTKLLVIVCLFVSVASEGTDAS